MIRNSSKITAMAAALGIVLAWSGAAFAQTSTSTTAMTFATSSPQSLWGAGAPTSINWCYPLALTSKGSKNLINLGTEFAGLWWGYDLYANWSVGAGIMPWLTASAGSLSMSYPGNFKLTYPDSVAVGQSMSISTRFVSTSGVSLTMNTPDLDFGVNFLMGDSTLTQTGSASLGDTITAFGISGAGPLNGLGITLPSFPVPTAAQQAKGRFVGAGTLWHLGSLPTSGSQSCCDDIISVDWSIEDGATVTANNTQAGVTTVSSNLASLTLDGNLTKAALIAAFPDGGELLGPAVQGSTSADFVLATLYASWALLDLQISDTVSLPLSVSFTSSPQVTLSFNQKVSWSDATMGASGTGTSATINVGDAFSVQMPKTALTITPTVALSNTVTSGISLSLQDGLYFQPLAVSVGLNDNVTSDSIFSADWGVYEQNWNQYMGTYEGLELISHFFPNAPTQASVPVQSSTFTLSVPSIVGSAVTISPKTN
jgi:hypothetical protein